MNPSADYVLTGLRNLLTVVMPMFTNDIRGLSPPGRIVRLSNGSTTVYTRTDIPPLYLPPPMVVEFGTGDGHFYRFISEDDARTFVPVRVDPAYDSIPMSRANATLLFTAEKIDDSMSTVFNEELDTYVTIYHDCHAASA